MSKKKIKWYCQDCGTEAEPRRKTCRQCRGKNFFSGAVWNEETKTFGCACGCKTGRMVAHFDGSNFYNSTIECSDCKNLIYTENAREKDEMSYWY